MVSSPKRMLLLKASAFFLFLSWLCSASSTSTPQRLLVGVAELPPRISSAPGHRTLSTLNLRGGNSDDDDDSGKSDKQSEIFEEEEEGGEEGDEESLITMLKNFTLDIPAEILDTQSNSTRDLVSDFEQRINDLVPRWPKKRLNRTLGRLADLFSDHLPTVYNYALALYEYGDYQRAEIYFTKALNLPRREEWNDCLVAALCNMGVLQHAKLSNFTYAEECYRAALAINPNHVNCLSNLAVVLQGGYQNPMFIPGHSSRYGSEQNHEVELLLRRALEIDPNHVPTLVHLGYFCEKVLQNHDEAECLYLKALEISPDERVALCNYAGFLCNVREPYDPDTLMPVYFNMTCNTKDNFDRVTSLPINPIVDRPVDRARGLYYKVATELDASFFPNDLDEENPDPRIALPLMHGNFLPAMSPASKLPLTSEAVKQRISTLNQQLLEMQALASSVS